MSKDIAKVIADRNAQVVKAASMYTPEKFYLETGLYQQWPIAEIWPENLIRILFCRTLDAYCVGCGKETVFKSLANLPEHVTEDGDRYFPIERTTGEKLANVESLVAADRAWFADTGGDDPKAWVQRPHIGSVEFYCGRHHTDLKHRLQFFYRIDSVNLMKIGQVPSVADIRLGDFKRFRRVLSEPDRKELTTGIGLYAHGVGIGSFVYLRRLFERQIERAHAEAINDGGWDESLFQRSRMDDRILLLKTRLPEVLVENRAVYGILSKGIHELSDDECKEFFEPVRAAIELILEEQAEKLEREDKVAETRKAIAELSGKLKK